MSQFEQENDFGRGGGEVDDETMEKAWDDAALKRTGDEHEVVRDDEEDAPAEPQPWAKASSGDTDTP